MHHFTGGRGHDGEQALDRARDGGAAVSWPHAARNCGLPSRRARSCGPFGGIGIAFLVLKFFWEQCPLHFNVDPVTRMAHIAARAMARHRGPFGAR